MSRRISRQGNGPQDRGYKFVDSCSWTVAGGVDASFSPSAASLFESLAVASRPLQRLAMGTI